MPADNVCLSLSRNNSSLSNDTRDQLLFHKNQHPTSHAQAKDRHLRSIRHERSRGCASITFAPHAKLLSQAKTPSRPAQHNTPLLQTNGTIESVPPKISNGQSVGRASITMASHAPGHHATLQPPSVPSLGREPVGATTTDTFDLVTYSIQSRRQEQQLCLDSHTMARASRGLMRRETITRQMGPIHCTRLLPRIRQRLLMVERMGILLLPIMRGLL